MVEWKPIDQDALGARIAGGEARMTPTQLRLWYAIRVEPAKWQQHPYGVMGDGFWAVGVIGRTVMWFNDIEDGFNRSVYSTYGVIEDYLCNQDELELAVAQLADAISRGYDLSHTVSEI